MIVRWQSDLVNTKESILPVWDQPYHANKRNIQKGEEIEVLRNCAFDLGIVKETVRLYTAVEIGRPFCAGLLAVCKVTEKITGKFNLRCD